MAKKLFCLIAAAMIVVAFSVSVVSCSEDDNNTEQAGSGNGDDNNGNDKPGGGNDKPDKPVTPEWGEKVTYTEDTKAFPNPERGFYSDIEHRFTDSSIPNPTNKAVVTVNRMQNRTLLLMLYYMNYYQDKPLSDELLQLVRTNLDVCREGGAKAILRFAYSSSESQKPWDTDEARVMSHIAQLKPIFQEYEDVIYVLQAGFVGVWGEWYYTDHLVMSPSTPEDYKPRANILKALLDAMPKSRQVQVRTPEATINCLGITYADTIKLVNAFDGSDRSRIAGHNDCFVSSSSDTGTFDGKSDRDFWKNDTRYTIMGGETCKKSSYCVCTNTIKEMEDFHWSYLNSGYNREVSQVWYDEGCYDEIDLRLGYRYVLTEALKPKSVKGGGKFQTEISLKNIGFSAIINKRDAELVIIAADNAADRHVIALKDDPRHWFAGGTYTIKVDTKAPALTAGKSYKLYLNLPDPMASLRNNPMFSVRTANVDTWDNTLGMNLLYTFTAE